MNLYILQEIANLFSSYKTINYIARVGDNLIKLQLDTQIFYVDLQKGKSNIFCAKEAILGVKKYNAPFDFALQKYCLKSHLLACNVDGNNRILRLKLAKKLQYKMLESTLQLEFTGKYTNAIILDKCEIILESLRKITQNTRMIKNGIKLTSLPQQMHFAPKKIALECNILDFLYQNNAQKNTRNLTQIKQHALQNIDAKIHKLQNLLDNLPKKSELESRSQNYAKIGELLQSNANARIKNNEITLQDYDGKMLNFCVYSDINRDKNLINEFFAKSKKLKSKAQNLTIQEENLKENIKFLEFKRIFITNSKNLSDIDIILQKSPQKSTKKQAKTQKYESFFIENTKISIGKNRLENIALLGDARANDIWMHIQNIPSSHLIIRSDKSAIKDEILRKAGEILVAFAKFEAGNFLVDYTKRKFVKIKDGANVVYANQQTILIKVP